MEYATVRYPTKTGKSWTMEDLEAAIEMGPHVSALDPETMKQLQLKVTEKEALGQAKLVLWEDIKKDSQKVLKISRTAMIPHKLRKFRAILDLSYTIKLMQRIIKAVNDTTTKTPPRGQWTKWGTCSITSSTHMQRQKKRTSFSQERRMRRMVFGGA